MSERKNIPELRFPEFNEEWYIYKLGELFSFITTNSFSRDQLNYEYGNVQNIHYGDIHTKFATLFNVEEEFVPYINNDISLNRIKEENYCEAGDVIFADASEDLNDVGKSIEVINLNNQKVLSGLHTIHSRPKKDLFSVGFLGFLMTSNFIRSQIQKESQGTKVLSISCVRLSKIRVNFPTIPEQQKIASFFSAIDQKIYQLKQKKILLEQYKKEVMRIIFSQEIRFSDENGQEFPKWEKKRLVDVAQFRRGSFPQPYGLEKWYDDENGDPFVQVFDVSDNFLLKTSTKRKISNQAKKFSVFVKKGSIVLTIQGSIGRIAITQYDSYVDRTLLIFTGYKTPINLKYFIYVVYLLFQIEKRKAPGGTLKTITKEVLSDFLILLPCKEEQDKIGNIIFSIDEKINLIQNQIEKAELWKKGLLQKMFI